MNTRQSKLFDAPLIRAKALKSERRYQEAIEILENGLRENPRDNKIKASLADVFYRTEQHRKAMKLAGEILKDDPNDPRALVVMGNVLLAKHKPTEALEYFELALSVAETDYLWTRKALAHLELKENQKASSAISNAQRCQPNSREVLRLKVLMARRQKNTKAERETLRQAAKVAPSEAHGFYRFVLPFFTDLSPRKAMILSESMRATPHQELNPYLLLYECQLLIKQRDWTAAAVRIESLLSSRPNDSIRIQAEKLQKKIQKT